MTESLSRGGLAERRKIIVDDRIDVIEISPSTTIYEDYLLLGCIVHNNLLIVL